MSLFGKEHGVSDLVLLSILTDDSITQELKTRFTHDSIYTVSWTLL